MITLLLRCLRRHVKHAKFIFSVPYDWNEELNNFSFVESKKSHFIFRVQLCLHLFSFLLQISLMIFSPYTAERKYQAMVFTMIYCTSLTLRWNWKVDNKGVEFLNALIHFERTFFKGCESN
jgi:hypothetical protein